MSRTCLYNNIRHKTARTLLVCAVLAAGVGRASMAAAQTFSHYTGCAYTSLNNKGMQTTHEIHYYYYVDKNASSINLALPFEKYTSGGAPLEPMGYFRWYDYTTDRASARLKAYAVATSLNNVYDTSGNNRGLIAYNLSAGPNQNNIGVTYTPPAEAKQEDWAGETIACDVSKYIDFGGHGGTFNAEPTLSYRCIFHILSGTKQARDIINTTSADLRGRSGDMTIEDNRRITFGAKDRNARLTLRLNNPVAGRYMFYPLKNTQKHLYAADDNYLIKSTDYNTSTIYTATDVQWRVYDQTKTKYTILITSTHMSPYVQFLPDTPMNTISNNRNGWKNLNGSSTSKPNITYGSIVYFVAYAKNGNNMAPIANFEVLYQNTHPKSRAEIIADGDNERMVSYLDSHYQQAMKPITFDDDNSEMDLSRPTTAENNASSRPSRWDKRTYGFADGKLYKYMKANGGYQYTPIHGEYGLFKSANLSGVSDGRRGYRWWPSTGAIFDRTYEMSGGKQYGHFLYVDASDESRQIAAADFKANLCSGARLIFSGFVADYTTGSTKPEVMFKLYGVIRDDNDSITDQRLITSFSSGDFSNNVKDNNVKQGVWMQVYSKLVLPRNSGAENYSDFRIVMDNMCKNTSGADYLIDDLRLYISPAKVDVVQNKPVCPDASTQKNLPNHITLKLRANYDNMLAMVGNHTSHVFYRICNADGTPVSGIDYDGDGKADNYGKAEIPEAYDTLRTLPAAAADGHTDVKMFETDAQNDIHILLANRYFNLPLGKQYYVSVAFPDEDDEDSPSTWGTPSNVCSTYSQTFEIVRQGILITDANGNVVTTVRVSCDNYRTPNVNINAKLETADVENGGKVTLNSVKFDWFLGRPDEENNFASIDNLQETLADYRAKYPDESGLNAAYAQVNDEGYKLLKKYVDAKQLVLSANNNLDNYKFGNDMLGTIKVAAIPIATSVTEGSSTYEICPDPMYFTLRIVEDGPKLTLGFGDVVYPTDDRALRIGLPQVLAMTAKDKELVLPVASLESSTKVQYDNQHEVFISDTNDPTWDNTKQIIGRLKEQEFSKGDSTLAVVLDKSAASILHEGYWYELNFSYHQVRVGSETVVSCPGETFLTLKVVPEYLSWNSTSENKLNSNWNNDLNWMRSTAADIYKADYTDYGTATYNGNAANNALARQQSYTPMKFSKVTITDQTGKVYPDMGNIVYRQSNKIATKLTNNKSEEATTYIAYDMEVKWNYDTDDGSDTGDGAFSCEKFQGNVCDEIYFKPLAELLDPCYLVYRRAYVEKELKTNKWYLASSPLRDTYAGDMYVPSANGRQDTEAFSPITFSTADNSRTLRPFYQRNWDNHAQETVDGLTYYEGYGYNDSNFRIDSISDASLNIESLYWSHVYNKVDEKYAGGRGFSILAGDNYYPANGEETWLVRLPKADTRYFYYTADNQQSGVSADVDKQNAYRMVVDPNTAEGIYSPVTQTLQQNVHHANGYYLVGNPYTASLSMAQFLKGNPALSNKVWTLQAGKMEAYTIGEDNNRQNDVIIEPMQAFFVKVADGLTANEVYFTTRMTVDRWVSGGASEQKAEAAITLTANDGQHQSNAKIRLNANADHSFNDDEDVELLANDDLDGIPQVYTVAGSEAVALNQTDDIDWMPVGVVDKETRTVRVTFAISRKLGDSYNLYDSATRKFTPIANGSAIDMLTNAHGRYYITRIAQLPDDGGNTTGIECFSPERGMIVASTPYDNISRITVYDTAGNLVTAHNNVDAQRCETLVSAAGVYIVRVECCDGNVKTTKLNVR